MLIKAGLHNIRISSRKLRNIAKAIASLSPKEALDHLKFLNKSGSVHLILVIKQAIANAVNNKKLKEEDLRFQKIEITTGPIMKRWRAVSRGRAHSIKKRTSNINIILESKEQTEIIKKSKRSIRGPKN